MSTTEIAIGVDKDVYIHLRRYSAFLRAMEEHTIVLTPAETQELIKQLQEATIHAANK